MTLSWRKLYQILLTVAVTLSVVNAQQERDPETQRTLPVSYETIPFYSTDTTASVVLFHYRINQRFFIYVRDPDDSGKYVAKGELMVELRNKQDVAVGREIRPIYLLRNSQPGENEELDDIQGAVSFQVPEDEYTVIVSIDDKESGRKFLDRDKKVTTRRPRQELLELSNPMFAELRHGNSGEAETYIIPANRGTNVTFGSESGFVYQVYLAETAMLTVRWKIQRQSDVLADMFQTFTGEQYTLINGRLVPIDPQQDASYAVKHANHDGWKILHIPLPVTKLDPGAWTIVLDLAAGEQQTQKQYTFQVLWLDRPASLLNSQISIDALQHIATEDELATMQSGSFERNIKAFYEFWKAKDPDTTTAYNEMLVEYYRRVDESNRRFSTLASSDGYKTDRGRIFILYGDPTRVERFIPPGEAPSEVWVYDRLKRRFIFSDKFKNGNFVLIAAENL